MQAAIYATPAVLQYAQMSEQVLRPGAPGRVASFIHERIPAGPEFHAFRAPNVDTLYSNAWVRLGAEPVELRLPDFGTRYFTVQVVDAYSNSINISARTFGSAAACYWLVPPDWSGDAPDGVTVVRVATTITWLLLRIQVLDGDLDVVRELQDEVSLTGGETGDALGPVVGADEVEADWRAFFRAFDAVLRLNSFPRDEWAHVRQFRGLGLLGPKPWDPDALDVATVGALERSFATAQSLLRSSRPQLGIATGTGWTRVLDKGAHGHNFLARAVMNHVGLGANVAEENTSFNTHVDSTGQRLAGRSGPYVLEFAGQPPQTAFWSVTLYRAETGRLHANPVRRHALGSAALAGDGGPARLVISHTDPGAANWLPCPEGEFYLILRIYSPGQEVVAGSWLPAAVRRGAGAADGL
ncbi:DUF1254 domain-containing protein [Saccharopolyspora sp. NFXS83]|uniref:DUF1254 domain-containing protein n=1 Tax=Saccharopolyspora sp. NFXS83 TaxID=2993560 RepID=UPI00224B9E62|nr:DUF1254 domain-containing protein [Saccharopolyspora sp. NFXS83]MCX2729151.1 DUF1254 domain-containing protein [Saccharopolyspora sp. NFXS83]